LSQLGRHDEAIEAARVAVRLGAYDAANLMTLSHVLSKADQHDEAVQAMVDLTRLTPYDGQAHFRLACLYERLGQRDNALESLRSSVELARSSGDLGATRDRCERTRELTKLRDDPRYAAMFTAAGRTNPR
jgi:tetratricopeptide (TPR) repeat protein